MPLQHFALRNGHFRDVPQTPGILEAIITHRLTAWLYREKGHALDP